MNKNPAKQASIETEDGRRKMGISNFEFRISKWILAGAVLALSGAAQAQVPINSSSAVTENFNTLGTGATASLPSGWKMSAAGAGTTAGYATAANVTATTQAAGSGNPSTGGRYNWGDGTTSTDRAIGFMTSGSYASPNGVMVQYQNNTGGTISALAVSFDIERYRINSAAASVTLVTSTDGTTWTAASAGDSGAFTTGTSSYTFTGGTVVSKSFNLTGLSIASGGSIYFKWNFNTTGGNSQGLGLDNVSVTATTSGGGTPSVGASGSVSGLFTAVNTPSEAGSISVSGSLLTANLTVTAPTGFEVSTSSGSGFGSSVSLTPTSGTVSSTPIYVRLAASSTGGAVSGNVTVASTGATSATVAVSGQVNSPLTLTFGPQDFEANNIPFVTYSVAGSANWNYVTNSTLGGGVTTAPTNKVMEVNGFGSDVAANDWLILGPIDASAANNPVITFNTLTRFANTAVNELTLKVSTNYSGTGNPANATWSTLTYNVPAANTINKTASGQVALTGAANQNNVYVAWHFQAGGTATGTTGLWQVDDVTVQNALKPALLISAPGTLNEGVLGQNGTVSIPTALQGDLTISVTSSDATELLVDGTGTPAPTTTVTIPAGSTSASFFIDALVDDEIDTDQTVTLTATVLDDSYESGTATVTVKNIDVPSASLGSSGYTQDFAGFAQATPTLPVGWSVSGPVTTFNTSTNSSGVLTDVNWGSGTGAGLRGNGSVLGYQHTSSTGTLIKTLVLKNTGTDSITALTIGYKGRATRLTETRIPIYTVTVNGTANSALTYSTAEGDLKLKSAVITGLDIQPNKTITISWSSDRGGTAGSARQIGISEVSVQLGANLTAPTLGVTTVNTGTLAQTTADVSGSVSGDGGAEVTERGFVYAATSANADPLVGGTGVTKVADASGGIGSFSAALTGLTANTGYSLKAYAINGQGTSYSSLVTFTTLPTPPTFSGTYTQNFTGFTNLATLPVGWTALSSAGVNNYVGEFSSGSSTGGFYGTTNTPGVLGYLHTSSTGTVTNKLTLINGTGGELTSLYVSYKGRVEATNNTRIPIMTVKLNGATVAELEYSTASGVDELKSTQVTGLSIADGAQFTVTWENDRGLSSGNSRRIGLTDVRVSTSAPNFTPTDIALSANSIPENNVIGESVGTLSSTDPDSSDTHTYSLVSGTGDTDNSSFTIDGSTLKAGVAFDFETKSSYSIRVRTTDLGNNTFDKVFTITVTDVNEAPAAPSNLSYTPSTISGTVGTPISNLTPTVTGTVTNWSVNPTLPAGLSINPSSGVISGTPTGVVWTSVTSTITASNAGGSTNTTVTAGPFVHFLESALGDFSGTTSAPTAIALGTSSKTLLGSVTGGSDSADYLTFTVPAGYRLDAITLRAYQATDNVAFIAIDEGATWTAGQTVSAMLGWSHFGGAGDVGTDLLAKANVAGGSLAAGTYTIWVQQLGAATAYGLEFELSALPAGSTFAGWSGGATTNSELVGKYGIGGATNISAASEKPVSAVDSNTLSLSAIVRTNDTNLTVVGEAGGSLTNWSTNGVSVAASPNTNGVPEGHQRKVFSVDRTNSPTRQFLRLKATLQP